MDGIANGQLAILDEASHFLSEARSIEEIRTIRNKAAAVQMFAKAANLGLQLQNRAAELKLRAERRAGTYVASLRLRGGNRKSKWHETTLKLCDLGISRDQSRRWRSVASVPETEFRQYLQATTALGREITAAGLLRYARKRPDTIDISVNRPSPRRARGRRTEAANEPQQMLVELTNHCHLLADILKPVSEGAEIAQLQRGERRALGHLLNEINQLISQLSQSFSSSHSSTY